MSTELGTHPLGKLDLLDPKKGIRPSKLGGEDLLSLVAEMGGLCYAAHTTNDRGLLKAKANHLWRHAHLLAAQIPGTVDNLPQQFRQIAANAEPEYRRERPLALINAGDVSAPKDLGDTRASCFIKMTQPGFEALRVAFKDPESRVRLHDDMKEAHYGRIERLQIDGGYLDGADIAFSPHLNALIGGRGTGKSTLIECLRYALGLEHKAAEASKQGNSIIDENLGKGHGRVEITLVSSQQQMLKYRVVRRYGEPLRVLGPDGNESSLMVGDLLPGIEVYGQNEIYELSRDDNALIRVLDRFLPERHQYEKDLDRVTGKLKANAAGLLQAEEQRDALAAAVQRLPALQEQAKQFDSIAVREKLKLVPLLEKERQLPLQVTHVVESLSSGLDDLRQSLPDSAFLSDKIIDNLPHVEIVRRIRTVLEQVREHVEGRIAAAARQIKSASTQVDALIAELERARSKTEDTLEKEFDSLPALAGKRGSAVGRAYQALQREIASIGPQQADLDAVSTRVSVLEQERRNLRGELSDLRNTRTRALEREVKRLNKELAGKLRLSVTPNGNREHLKSFLTRLPGFGTKTVAWVDDATDLTIPALVEACRAGKAAVLAKKWSITSTKADAICKLGRAELLELETVDLEDRVVLELNTAHDGEAFRPLGKLSTGQQCTAILHLLLLERTDPLVIDQPEDNLDNAFIANRIVQELRAAKTNRQFLFATHNANIPVFGDAEWIGVFTSADERGSVPRESQGSIDVPLIRDEAARILDGGRKAFLQRQQKYGY